MYANSTREKTRSFIEQLSPRARARPLLEDEPLLEHGVVDSFGVIEIVAWIEREFGVEVSEDDLVLSNFQTIRQIADLITRKQGPGADSGVTRS